MKGELEGYEQELSNRLPFFLFPLLVLTSPPLNEIVEECGSLEPAGSA